MCAYVTMILTVVAFTVYSTRLATDSFPPTHTHSHSHSSSLLPHAHRSRLPILSFVMDSKDVELMEWCQGLGQMETTVDPQTGEEKEQFKPGDQAYGHTHSRQHDTTHHSIGARE